VRIDDAGVLPPVLLLLKIKWTGEIYFRRVNLWNHPPSGWFLDRTKHADFLVQTLKRYALQTHLDADALPDAAALRSYKVTLFHIDSDKDKILISSGQDLCDVLLQVRSEAVVQLHMGGSTSAGATSRQAKPVAKIIAKVEELEVVLGDEEEPLETGSSEETPSSEAKNRSTAATQTSGNTEEEPSTTEDEKKEKEESPAAPETAPRTSSSSSNAHAPPTVQDVVDAVVGIVGPAVRISVRAIEHAVVAHNNHNADRALRAYHNSSKNNTNTSTTEPEINVSAETAAASSEAPKEEAAPEARPFIHGRHTCDGCLTTPIVGERHHCLDLPDFDFCQACYQKYDGPHKFEPVELGTICT
jgi:Zinc finger, ZZ type